MPKPIKVTITKPIPVPSPDVDYDGAAVWLAVAPREIEGQGVLDYTASMTVRPYRTLAGKVDYAPESMTRTVNLGSIGDAMEAGDQYGQVAGAILAILQQGLAGLGG